MKLRVWAWSGLILLAVCALAADGLAPYSPREENRRAPHHPPSRIHWQQGTFLPHPFVYATQLSFDEFLRKRYEEKTDRKFFLHFFYDGRFVRVDEPAKFFLLGADARGRDLFSRILYGARVSISIGLLGALISSLAGFFVGGVAGYFGGRLDGVLMRLCEFFIMIPGFYFLLALRSVLPPGLGSRQVYLLIVLILSLIGWGGIARVIRGMVFSIRENDFIPAARVLGRGHLEIIFRHVLPHTLPYLGLVITTSVPAYILGESALSVLGLGIQEPDVSWGSLLMESVSVAHLSLHPWVLWPGFFIVGTAFCFQVLGDQFTREIAR